MLRLTEPTAAARNFGQCLVKYFSDQPSEIQLGTLYQAPDQGVPSRTASLFVEPPTPLLASPPKWTADGSTQFQLRSRSSTPMIEYSTQTNMAASESTLPEVPPGLEQRVAWHEDTGKQNRGKWRRQARRMGRKAVTKVVWRYGCGHF